MVTDCKFKHIADLPFDFLVGTCGTFTINFLPTILLCFDWIDSKTRSRRCRSLTRRNDGPLSDIKDFDVEFEVNKVAISDSAHPHLHATMANYFGFPLILGGSNNNNLEMLNTMESPPAWIEHENYPYSTG